MALATPVQFWSGRRFYRGAWKALRGGTANMDVLVALGTSVAYGFSAFALFQGLHLYFEASAVVITLVLLGKYLEARAKAKAARSLESLIRLQPSRAFVESDGFLVEVDAATLKPGDEFEVRPGDAIAVDGAGDRGRLERRTSRCSPASRSPVAKSIGAHVYAGTINGEGTLKVRRDRHRPRHRARRHHPPGRRRAGLQAAGAAPGRPGVRRVRAGGARHRRHHLLLGGSDGR